ncbi:host-nuclease inhibitor Gam family protein [Brevundimonas faecalis]|uniref:host-nuclease inhibitor Gam family protein n=1 Tax=Brevundimonas faecalis TaxID=947378 RepID=UPI00361047BA
MAAKTKSRALPAAQTREEAEAGIGRLGDIQREIARINADLGDKSAALKAEAESLAAPLIAEAEDIRVRVQGWCEANRAALTRDGKVKFADLATGKVTWRALPPKVSIRKVETVLEVCRRLGLTQFVRTKREVNKEVMLAEPELARTIPGVTIGSEGEEFAIEPFQPEVVGAAA